MLPKQRFALIAASVVIGVGLLLTAAFAAVPRAQRFTSEHLSIGCSQALNASLDIVSFSVCSPPERRFIYRTLSRVERTELWRQHLSGFLTLASHLTDTQRASVREVLARVDVYMGEGGASALEEDGFTQKHLSEAFGEDLARAIFATLGTEVRYLGHTAGETRIIVDHQNGSLIGISYGIPGEPPVSDLPSLPPYCNCSEGSDWCCDGECGLGIEDCIVPEEDECGTLWIYECDGLCGSWT